MFDAREKLVLKGFGTRLRLLRSVFGFSKPKFAETLGIERHALAEYEKGERRPPLYLLRQITGITQCDLDFLISGKSFGSDARGTGDAEVKARSQVLRTSGWYWETDHNHRVTLTCRPDKDRTTANGIIGWTHWEYVGMNPERNRFWRRHIDILNAHRPFENFVFKGHKDFIQMSGKPAFDQQGNFVGYRGYASTVSTERALDNWRTASIDFLKVG